MRGIDWQAAEWSREDREAEVAEAEAEELAAQPLVTEADFRPGEAPADDWQIAGW